jgi:hypothetical protein
MFAPLLALLLAAPGADPVPDVRALLFGGGPTPQSNQVAIESNVRYLLRLLPESTQRTVLFADGTRDNKTVQFQEEPKPLSNEEKVTALLMRGRNALNPVQLRYRATELSRVDGALKRADIGSAFDTLTQAQKADPKHVLLYFTGHGSRSRSGNLENNDFDLWGDRLNVQDLAAHIAGLPETAPVTVVMVQCFSGAFGNLLFEGGDPKRPMIKRDIAGFFATVKERVAAGCTPELNEAEYHDFTSYFFAALTGVDRVGRRVTGADYDGDGRVGMNEAFCYTLAHDASIDVPICTTDVFLRAVVQMPEEKVFENNWSSVRRWATPAQAAALDELSRKLGLSGEDRARQAYAAWQAGAQQGAPTVPAGGGSQRDFAQALQAARQELNLEYPDLTDPRAPGYGQSRIEAEEYVRKGAREGKYNTLLDLLARTEGSSSAAYRAQLAEAQRYRLVRLYKSIVLAHTLQQSEDAPNKARYAELVRAEARTILPRAAGGEDARAKLETALGLRIPAVAGCIPSKLSAGN